MDSIKQLTTEAMQELEEGNSRVAIALLADAIEDLSATIEAARERDAYIVDVSSYGLAEVTI